MPLPIWPTSPVPANMTRTPIWGESVQRYDSGAEQGSTPYVKPLMTYQVTLQNIPRTKQTSLSAFINTIRSRTSPFLFTDPYDNRVNGAVCVRSDVTGVRSFFVRTAEGYPVIPTSGTLLITSVLSGPLTQGTHYQFDPDTGVFSTPFAMSTADIWTASCAYYRKCKLDSYSETSQIWEIFSGTVAFHEIALP